MKRHLKKIFVLSILITLLSSFSVLMFSSQPPQNYTGADGDYCTSCHSSNPLNSVGGSVAANGLPAGTYTAGTPYHFAVSINHSAANRRRFGFSIVARNSLGQNVGTFSGTNPNAANNGNEYAHFNAPLLASGTQSYTYDNLTWTAPVNPGVADQNITFYIVSNAANGSGSSGDFIYAATVVASLSTTQTYTFTGNGNWSDAANWSNGLLPPAILTGNAAIVIDPPAGAVCVLDVPQQLSAGVSLEVKAGKQFVVNGNLVINQ
jgi:hypothetical protein